MLSIGGAGVTSSDNFVDRLIGPAGVFELDHSDPLTPRFLRGPKTIPEILGRARAFAKRPHLVTDERVYSFGETLNLARRVANALTARWGASGSSRIGLVIGDPVTAAIVFTGVAMFGGVAFLVPHAPNRQSDSASWTAAFDILIFDGESQRAMWFGATHRIDVKELVGAVDAGADAPLRPACEDDEALALFSGGSSGPPKCVMHTQSSVVAGLKSMMLAAALQPAPRSSAGQAPPMAVSLLCGPLAHVSGVCQLLFSFMFGNALGFASSFPKPLARVISHHRVSALVGVGEPVVRGLLDELGASEALPGLQTIVYAGARLPAKLAERLKQQLPDVTVKVGYGLTETMGAVTGGGMVGPGVSPGAVGRVPPSLALRFGPRGEIALSGMMLMKGYVDLQTLRTQPRRPGWFETGDLGRLGEEGELVVIGRSDEVLAVGDSVIAFAAIEDLALRQGDIGQAFVCPARPGADEPPILVLSSSSDAHDTAELVKRRIEDRYPQLSGHLRISTMEALPRTAAGKVDRRAMQALLRRGGRDETL